MKTHLRENRLSATTRRRVINIIAAIHRREAIARRIDRAWRPVKPNFADLRPEPSSPQ